MPEKRTIERAAKAKREGKSPSTQGGEFVREEMHRMHEGEGSVKSPKQAVAIGLSKARQAGVAVKPPKKGTTSETTRKRAQRDAAKGAQAKKAKTSDKPSASHTRAKATPAAPKGEGRATASSSSRSKSRAGTAKSRTGKKAQP